MEKINNYIIEKLKINKDSKNITKEPGNYKGIELDVAREDSIENFVKYAEVSLVVAFELLAKIIDNFVDDLKPYVIYLFSSGHNGFKFIHRKHDDCLGFLMFDKSYKKELESKTGIGCYFVPGANCPDKMLAYKLKEYIGTSQQKFNS